MMMNDKEKESHAQFNMSLATLIRIDALLKMAESGTGILMERHAILHIYKEVYPFLNDAERAEGQKMYDIVMNGFPTDKSDNTKFWITLDGAVNLEKFDFWIRDKLNEKGLLMAKSDDPSSALGGG